MKQKLGMIAAMCLPILKGTGLVIMTSSLAMGLLSITYSARLYYLAATGTERTQWETGLFGILGWSLVVIMAIATTIVVMGLVVGLVAVFSIENGEEQELPEPLESAVLSNHGHDLLKVMTSLREEPLEYRAAFTLDGAKITEGTLKSPDRCNFTSDGWESVFDRGASWIDLHNHPGVWDLPFSEQDLRNFVNNTLCLKKIVVTKNYTYILEKTSSYGEGPDWKEACDYIEEAFDISTSNLCEYLFQRSRYTACIRKIAKRFGLEFRVESLKAQRHQAWLDRHKGQIRFAVGTAVFALVLFVRSITANDSVIATQNVVTADEVATQVNYGVVSEFDRTDDADNADDSTSDFVSCGYAKIGSGSNRDGDGDGERTAKKLPSPTMNPHK